MNTLRLTCQRNLYQLRQFHKCIIQQQEAAATAAATTATTTATEPSASETVSTKNETVASSKIEQIADQIVSLNLIEVAQLSDILKKRLNLSDAPVMPMGGFVAAPAKEDEEEEAQTVVQTAFTVKLTGFDEKQKVALIKELKSILPDCNLVQAKKFVESAPAVIKSELTKEEADQLVESIQKVGGKVEVV